MSFISGEHTAEDGRETSIYNLEILRSLEYMFKARVLAVIGKNIRLSM